jgi:predicted nucleotidyltransferase
MNERLAIILNELRRALETIYGERLEQVILFGSQARGDAQFGSDIDVLRNGSYCRMRLSIWLTFFTFLSALAPAKSCVAKMRMTR